MTQLSRRRFLQAGTAVGVSLVIGLDTNGTLAVASTNTDASINPFLKIDGDGTVTVIAKHFEMGQGTSTGLATLVAEELDANWDDVKVDFAPANNALYSNLFFKIQGTGGSTAMANSFMQYREAGASARDLLVRAAAKDWGVDASEITISEGLITHGSKSAGFGDVASTATTLEPVASPVLKQPADFTLIGRDYLQRKDSVAKTNGTAEFAMDVKVPNMLYVTLLRAPCAGGKLATFDASGAKDAPGFIDAMALPNKAGVAIYADSTYASIRARKLITATWDDSEADTRGSEAMMAEHVALVGADPQFPATPVNVATVSALNSDAAKMVDAQFTLPNLAHAPMEPMNCVIEPTATGVRVHDGCQMPTITQGAVAAVLQLAPENVEIRTVFAGGSFGRRANTVSDYHVEAAMAYALKEGKHAIKLIWSREDDLAGGFYRPMSVQKVSVGLDENGRVQGWEHRLASQSIMKGTPFESMVVHDGVDHSTVEGIVDTLYQIPQMAVGVSDYSTPRPALWWRAVGHSQNAFTMEIMMDMLAHAADEDPVDYRLSYLDEGDEKGSRFAEVIRLAAKESGWHERQKGEGYGFAAHFSFNTYVAEVAKVSLVDGKISIDKFTCAVDCGIAINPDVIRAQMEGAIGYGLGAIMRNQISFKDGVVEQSNFPDYEPLRISDMPDVAVHIVTSNEAPSGAGEPGLPPAGAALSNAIFDLTGNRNTELPMTVHGVSFA